MDRLLTTARAAWRVTPRRGVQEWCDSALHLSQRVAYQAGPWATVRFPYERGIMWLWQQHAVREVYLQWGTRLGKTVMIPALVAWAAANDPGPAMIATSNKNSAQLLEGEKLYPMLEDCPTTAAMLPSLHKRVFSRVDLHDMLCYVGWSGSATELGEKSVRYLFLSELDKWTTEQSREADAEMLACERTKDWPNAKIFKESTPTLEFQSRIEANLKQADVVLQYHVPCPHCGEYQVLTFERVKWSLAASIAMEQAKADGGQTLSWGRDPKTKVSAARESAFYECLHCKAHIQTYDRGRMLRHGVWAPAMHQVPRGHDSDRTPVLFGMRETPHSVGTQLSSLYSPTLSWGDMAAQFLRCGTDPRKLQNWRNSWEALPWAPEVEITSWTRVKDRLSTQCPRGIVPAWAIALTAGADIGRHELHYIVRAWGKDERSQLVEEGCMAVDYAMTDLRGAILSLGYTVLERDFIREGHDDPPSMRVGMLTIDSGWPESSPHVYEISNIMGIGKCRAIKGATIYTGARAPWQVTILDTDPATGKRLIAGGQKLFLVDSPYWQGWLNGKIRMEIPRDNPGAWLLHATPHEDYMRQICNVVVRSKRSSKGRPVYEYSAHDGGVGVHYHDCEYYAAIAADMLGIRRIARAFAARGGATPNEKGNRAPERRRDEPAKPRMDYRQMDYRR